MCSNSHTHFLTGSLQGRLPEGDGPVARNTQARQVRVTHSAFNHTHHPLLKAKLRMYMEGVCLLLYENTPGVRNVFVCPCSWVARLFSNSYSQFLYRYAAERSSSGRWRSSRLHSGKTGIGNAQRFAPNTPPAFRKSGGAFTWRLLVFSYTSINQEFGMLL